MSIARQPAELLIFVEDPGAANMVADLPAILRGRGHKVHLATSGVATDYLRRRGVLVHPLDEQSDLETVVAEIAPRLIVSGTAENPDSIGLRLTAIAKAKGIRSIGVLDSATNLDFRFRGRGDNAFAYCPDRVVVPDTVSRDGLVALSLAAARIVVAGHPHWDHVRSVCDRLGDNDRTALRRRNFGLAAPGPLAVLFAAEISGGMDPGQFRRSPEYTLTGSGHETGRTEIVIEEFLAAVAPRRQELHLVLRLHPKQAADDLSQFRSSFDTVSQAEPSLEVIFAADRVVGMTSMLMIEAALMRKPTFAILPRRQEVAWLTTLAAGVTPHACTRGAVSAGIGRFLDAPQLASSPDLDSLLPRGAVDRIVAALEQDL